MQKKLNYKKAKTELRTKDGTVTDHLLLTKETNDWTKEELVLRLQNLDGRDAIERRDAKRGTTRDGKGRDPWVLTDDERRTQRD